MAQRRDHGAGHEPESLGGGGDRREQQEGARPWRPRILVVGHRVVARVVGRSRRARAPPEHDVLTHHHRVEPRVLRVDGEPYEPPQVTRRHQGPVLAKDQDQLRGCHGTSGSGRSSVWSPGRFLPYS